MIGYLLTALGAFLFGALIVAIASARRASRDAVTIVDAQTLNAQLTAECRRLHALADDARDVNERLVKRLSAQPAPDDCGPEAA